MTMTIGQPERFTQQRVINLFREELGYRYLGDWTDRDGNSNVEEKRLSAHLTKSGYTREQIAVALYRLRVEADNHNRGLYGNNQAVYNLLRYGAPVKLDAGKVTETVKLINWTHPEQNDFAIAEEVTLHGNYARRPDLVLYVNGIAVGRELMTLLGQAKPRLLCSLVHKFGRRGVDDFEQFIQELEAQPSAAVGDLFVFVDECHRTQSGKLHRTMKALLPKAVFIGFTGTPLLKQDKQTSLEIFGGYIHTYKFSEAVADEVVLDLIYEARDIDQRLGSTNRIDAWFDAKTRGINDWQKAALREQWGTMQHVLSSRSRMDRVVQDIVFDFSVKPRLSNERGNAILVASSIYEACKYFELFQKTVFKGKCAVVTSYNPQAGDISLEDTGANTETDKQFIFNTYTELLKTIPAQTGMNKTEAYEERAKDLFKKQPANMKLLVVDKLLTGFDAPSCTYLYIDTTPVSSH